jgi:hypothetical protein
MSDLIQTNNIRNIIPIDIDDSVKNKLFITIEGEEIQLNYLNLDLTFQSTEQEIMNKVVPIVQEQKGVNISDTYKVRKAVTNENIFIYPNSTAGIY